MIYCSKGCSKFNRPEFKFNIDDAVVPDVDARWLVDHLEQQVANGAVFKDGETIQIGWMLNQFSLGADNRLRLLEPDMTDMPIVYIDSVTSTLKHLRQQKDTVESCAVEAQLSFPGLRQAIVVSNNYPESRKFFMNRDASEASMSGWFFRDISNTDTPLSEDDFDVVSLYEFACKRPDLIKFFALPEGFGVVVQDDGMIHIVKGQEEIPIKPQSYLDRLNAGT